MKQTALWLGGILTLLLAGCQPEQMATPDHVYAGVKLQLEESAAGGPRLVAEGSRKSEMIEVIPGEQQSTMQNLASPANVFASAMLVNGEATLQVPINTPVRVVRRIWDSEQTLESSKPRAIASGISEAFSLAPDAKAETVSVPNVDAPAVSSVAIGSDHVVTLVFNQAMDASSFSTQSADGACSGSLQLSKDSFGTCLGISSLTWSSDAKTASLAAGSLTSSDSFKLLVGLDARDTYGSGLTAESTTSIAAASTTTTTTTTSTSTTSTSTSTSTTSTSTSSSTSSSSSSTSSVTRLTGSMQAYIKASNAEAGDHFGNAIALAGDTLAVMAPDEDSNQTTITNGTTASANNSVTNAGAVYVYLRSGTTWAQEAYLKPDNMAANLYFGISNAVDVTADTIAVGTYQEDSNQTTITTSGSANTTNTDSGAVYVFKRSGTTWSQEAYIKPSNNYAGMYFGYSVAVYGDTLAVGAIADKSLTTTIATSASSNTDANYLGAIHVFKRSGSTWTLEAYIKASNNDPGDKLGYRVALYGDTLVATAPCESSNQTTVTNGTTASSDNSNNCSGAAYVFTRSGTTWTQQAYLKPPVASANNEWGQAVAIDQDTIVVGNTYEDSADTTISSAGVASSDTSASNSGAADIYVRSGTSWSHQAHLKPDNNRTLHHFGYSVAVKGEVAVVGVQQETSIQNTITQTGATDNITTVGAVFMFQRSGTTWYQTNYIKPPISQALSDNRGLQFGTAVDYDAGTLVVGAPYDASSQTSISNGTSMSNDTSATGAGSAFVFTFQ